MGFLKARQPNEVLSNTICICTTANRPLNLRYGKNQTFSYLYYYIYFLSGIIILFLSSLFLFSCSKKNLDTPPYCELKLDPKAFDSIYLDLSLRPHLPYLDLSSNRVQQFNGNIKSIEEVTSKQEIRFDENVEIPKSMIRYFFNEASLISKEEHFNSLLDETPTRVIFTYDPQNKLIRKEYSNRGFSSEKYNTIDYYSYNIAGLPLQQTTYTASAGTQVPQKPFSIRYTQYNDQNLINQIKLVKFMPYDERDSLIVKYSYDTKKRLSSIVFYDKNGQRQVFINVSFLENLKQIKITSFNVLFSQGMDNYNSEEDALEEIILGYNDNCQLSFITQVEKINRAEFVKRFKKIELNSYNDIVLLTEYELKTEKDNSLRYIEDTRYEGRNKKFEKYTYRYDSLGNWIEKKEHGQITRRIITYKM